MLPSGLDNFLGSDFREPVKNYLADFFRLGGRYPPIPLREKIAKKELFLAKKTLILALFDPFFCENYRRLSIKEGGRGVPPISAKGFLAK